jgi:ribosomal protein S1
VRKLARVGLCAAVLSAVASHSVAQGQPATEPKSEHAQDTFFSGNVISITTDKVTVSRRTLALSTVTRVFLLDANTQIEGKAKLQPKARVTIKFEKTDDGDRAVHIIVR